MSNIPSKEELWLLSGKELSAAIEKESIWNLFEADVKLQNKRYKEKHEITMDDAFNPENPNAIFYCHYEDHSRYLETKRNDEVFEASMFYDYHHELEMKEPYWATCVNKIDNALKN